MLPWNALNQKLETAANQHLQLSIKFHSFAKLVEEQVTQPGFHIKRILVTLHLDQDYFTTTFAGHTLRFTFYSILAENDQLLGVVSCNLIKDLTDKPAEQIGQFTFKIDGETKIKNPESDRLLVIDDDFGALYIGLQFIYMSLTRQY